MHKNVLIISRNFPPLLGGMEKLIWNVYDQLKTSYQLNIIGPIGCRKHIVAPHEASECPVSPLFLFLQTALLKGLLIASKKKYSIIFAGSGITAPLAVIIGKLHKIPVITYVHGLDLIAKNTVYQSVFVPAIKRSNVILANSNNTAFLAESKGVPSEKIEILYPGVETTRTNVIENKLFSKLGLSDKKVLLSVGRLVSRKGIVEFLKFSFPKIIKECPDVVLLIIGSEPKSSLKKDKGVLQNIIKSIDDNKLHGHVVLIDRVDENELHEAYLFSKIHVFPVRDVLNDIEGFGMVAIESAAHGLPTIAFAVGGVVDAVKHLFSGLLVESGDYNRLAEDIIEYLKGNNFGITSENCKCFARQFSWEIFGKKLLNICGKIDIIRNDP